MSDLSSLIDEIILNEGGYQNNANESISGRSHRLSTKYTFWKGMKGLVDFIFQDNHCEQAYFNDVERAKKTVEAAEEAQNS